MELDQIIAYLKSSDFAEQVKALKSLKEFESDVAVPLIKTQLHDPEYLVRTISAKALGHHRNTESFAALLEMLKFDPDPNVRAEAANSLSLFGSIAAAHLVTAFCQNDHWLIRRTIIATLMDMDCPGELYEVCTLGLGGEDDTVREACITCLATLANSSYEQDVLEKLLPLAHHQSWRIRSHLARCLKSFADNPKVPPVLTQFKQDPDHHVVGAALEWLVEDPR